MKEHLNDYEKRIWEGMEQDAEEILKELEADEEAMAVSPSEELDRKIYAMIHGHESADPAMEGLSEEDQEALRLGRELQNRRKEEEADKARTKKKRLLKRISAAAAVIILVAGAGITGVGGPKRIVEMVEQSVGGRKVSKVNSSKKSAKTMEDEEEEQAYQQIKDELGFDPVRIVGKPENMQYMAGEIDSDMQMAQLLYKYGKNNISYMISASYSEKVTGADVEDKNISEYEFTEGKLKAEITEYELEDSDIKEYSAEFEYKDVQYQITGVMKKDEFEKILKNLHFPS